MQNMEFRAEDPSNHYVIGAQVNQAAVAIRITPGVFLGQRLLYDIVGKAYSPRVELQSPEATTIYYEDTDTEGRTATELEAGMAEVTRVFAADLLHDLGRLSNRELFFNGNEPTSIVVSESEM